MYRRRMPMVPKIHMERISILRLDFSLENINTARHTCDLIKQDITYLRIDYKVSGVGAYSLLDKYKLLEKEIAFRFSMKPVRIER